MRLQVADWPQSGMTLVSPRLQARLTVILFALLFTSVVLADSTFFDNPDEAFIMGDVVMPGPVTPPSTGGGGGAAPECVNDAGCELGEYCFENKCYVYECDSDADCNDTKTCWMNRCVKLFDMKIIDVQSPITSGETFDFTYYIKGVAAIHGDVVVTFWLVQDGEIVTEGFDTIYMADFEEVTETSELFLPKSIKDGVYNFYTEVAYDSYYARAGRLIEVGEGGILEELLDVSFDLASDSVENADDLSAFINFDSFGTIPARVNLTFTIIDSNGDEVYSAEDSIVIRTSEFLKWDYIGLDLPEGDYIAVLNSVYGEDIKNRFTQKFSVEKRSFITGDVIGKLGEGSGLVFLIVIAILVLGLIVYWERNKLKNLLYSEEKWLKKYKVSIATTVLFGILIGMVFYLNNTGAISLPSFGNSFSEFFIGMLLVLVEYSIYLVWFVVILLVIFLYNALKVGSKLRGVVRGFKGGVPKTGRRLVKGKASSKNFWGEMSARFLGLFKKDSQEEEVKVEVGHKPALMKPEREKSSLFFARFFKKSELKKEPKIEKTSRKETIEVPGKPGKIVSYFSDLYSKTKIGINNKRKEGKEKVENGRREKFLRAKRVEMEKRESRLKEKEEEKLKEKRRLVSIRKREIIAKNFKNYFVDFYSGIKTKIRKGKMGLKRIERIRRKNRLASARRNEKKKQSQILRFEREKKLEIVRIEGAKRKQELEDLKKKRIKEREMVVNAKKRNAMFGNIKKYFAGFYRETGIKLRKREEEREKERKARHKEKLIELKIAKEERLAQTLKDKRLRKRLEVEKLIAEKEKIEKRRKLKKKALMFFGKVRMRVRKKMLARAKRRAIEKKKSEKLRDKTTRAEKQKQKAMIIQKTEEERVEKKMKMEGKIKEKASEKKLLELKKIRENVERLEEKEKAGNSKLPNFGFLKNIKKSFELKSKRKARVRKPVSKKPVSSKISTPLKIFPKSKFVEAFFEKSESTPSPEKNKEREEVKYKPLPSLSAFKESVESRPREKSIPKFPPVPIETIEPVDEVSVVHNKIKEKGFFSKVAGILKRKNNGVKASDIDSSYTPKVEQGKYETGS